MTSSTYVVLAIQIISESVAFGIGKTSMTEHRNQEPRRSQLPWGMPLEHDGQRMYCRRVHQENNSRVWIYLQAYKLSQVMWAQC